MSAKEVGRQGGGDCFPELVTEVPGPLSKEYAHRLHEVECAGITFVGEGFPVFWERALGANVWDVDGNRFVDLTAAFGVASCGHSHPELAMAASRQATQLMHGMGDVHPPLRKLELLEKLSQVTPGSLSFGILGQNGADAVEAALKAAYLHTGRSHIVAFGSAYHGLSGMALEVTDFPAFRDPFSPYMGDHVHVVKYPRTQADLDVLWEQLESLVTRFPVGAILAEPIQGRGGVIVPPDGFLEGLRQRANGTDTVLILDEIYTGFSRTGRSFACEHDGVIPDLLCLGKGLTGGFPLSVCVGTPEVMASWPKSSGEAIHTSTFLGNPIGCAVGIRSMELHEELELAERSERLGREGIAFLKKHLDSVSWVREVRGRGLMMGVELFPPEGEGPSRGVAGMLSMLSKGYLILPSGPGSHVLSLSPPLTITDEQWDGALNAIVETLTELS